MMVSKWNQRCAVILLTFISTWTFDSTHALETALGEAQPEVTKDTDRASVQLGVKFRAAVDGKILGIRFFRAQDTRGGFPVALHDASGQLLGYGRSAPATALPGYVEALMKRPVSIKAGVEYTASYLAPRGRYAVTLEGLAQPITSGNLKLMGSVYAYTSKIVMPTQTYRSSNYFVDVIFEPSQASAPPPPAPTPSPMPTPTPVPAPMPGSGFTLGQVPFATTSSWNTPISAAATYTRLAWPASTGYNYWVNWDQYSPAVHVASPSDPIVQVSMPANWGYPAGNVPVRMPIGATGAMGTDGELLIIDGTTVHNFWMFKRTSNTSATTAAYGRTDLITGSGWGTRSPFQSAGIVAAGSSQLAGLLVKAETDKGEINHALQISLLFELQKPGFTGEAISGDGSNANGIAIEGQRLAIPPSAAMPAGLSVLGQKVFRALQRYGAFNIDVAGATTFRAQANAYSAAEIEALCKDVQKLMPMLHRVN